MAKSGDSSPPWGIPRHRRSIQQLIKLTPPHHVTRKGWRFSVIFVRESDGKITSLSLACEAPVGCGPEVGRPGGQPWTWGPSGCAPGAAECAYPPARQTSCKCAQCTLPPKNCFCCCYNSAAKARSLVHDRLTMQHLSAAAWAAMHVIFRRPCTVLWGWSLWLQKYNFGVYRYLICKAKYTSRI